jgi:hypothetical protein
VKQYQAIFEEREKPAGGNRMPTPYFRLEIEMGNEAMQTYADIASATRRIFADFANRPELLQDDSGRIYDVNGNKVGHWSADEVEPEEDESEDDEDEDEE